MCDQSCGCGGLLTPYQICLFLELAELFGSLAIAFLVGMAGKAGENFLDNDKGGD